MSDANECNCVCCQHWRKHWLGQQSEIDRLRVELERLKAERVWIEQ